MTGMRRLGCHRFVCLSALKTNSWQNFDQLPENMCVCLNYLLILLQCKPPKVAINELLINYLTSEAFLGTAVRP